MEINKSEVVNTYMLSDIDESGNPQYHGYINDEGGWYIRCIVVGSSVRYYKKTVYG